MRRIAGTKNKSKLTNEENSKLIFMQNSIDDGVLNDENEEDDFINQAIIMLGDCFRILVSRMNKTLQEKVKVVNKDTKEESEQWKNRGYFGKPDDAIKEAKRLVAYNKICDKKYVASISELVDIMKESNLIVEGWFKGTSGV
jgi:hypothetical protein